MTRSTIRIPTPLRSFTAGEAELAVTAGTVRDALAQIGARHADFLGQIVDDAGNLRAFVNVFKGNVNLRQLDGLDTELAPGDVLTILPAVAGGAR